MALGLLLSGQGSVDFLAAAGRSPGEALDLTRERGKLADMVEAVHEDSRWDDTPNPAPFTAPSSECSPTLPVEGPH